VSRIPVPTLGPVASPKICSLSAGVISFSSPMNTSPTPDLIFDVGMNNGDDAAFYLECGFRVVAVEANEAFCGQVAARFPEAVRDGRLVIQNVAVRENLAKWSSGSTKIIRNGAHSTWPARLAAAIGIGR